MNKLGPSVRVHKVEWERILRGDPVEASVRSRYILITCEH